MIIPPLITAFLCLAFAVAAAVSERLGWGQGRALFKVIASTAFVILGLQCGAADSFYGRLLLIGLGLCWLGDVFLLSFQKTYFLLGTVSFLFAHFAFIAAFASRPLSWSAFWIGLAFLGAFGTAILVWLRHRLAGIFKIAIPAYIAAIITMSSLAVAESAAAGSIVTAAGAIAFTASDVSVARDRFVARNVANYGWGLPLYFLAMILLAMSAAWVS